MKQFPMKNLLTLAILAISCTAVGLVPGGFLRAQPTTPPAAVKDLLIVDSTKSGFALITVTPSYRVYVGDWLVINGREPADRAVQNVTFGDPSAFAPEFVRVEAKREPVVRQLADGRWEITFKAAAP